MDRRRQHPTLQSVVPSSPGMEGKKNAGVFTLPTSVPPVPKYTPKRTQGKHVNTKTLASTGAKNNRASLQNTLYRTGRPHTESAKSPPSSRRVPQPGTGETKSHRPHPCSPPDFYYYRGHKFGDRRILPTERSTEILAESRPTSRSTQTLPLV